MPDGIISAPTTLAPMVADLNKVAADINRLMEDLQREGAKLRSVSSGEVFAAFSEAERLWKNSGLGESSRTAVVAAKSDEFAMNMNQVDRRAASDFSV